MLPSFVFLLETRNFRW